MFLNRIGSLCKYRNVLNHFTCKCKYMVSSLTCSKITYSPITSNSNRLVISCKRKEYNYYRGQTYDRLLDIKHASKGWNHRSAKGDYFTIYPNGTETDKPCVEFNNLKISEEIQNYLKKTGIVKATQFQAQAIPLIHQRQHVLLAAETGCGKTLAYLIPIIQNISRQTTTVCNMPKVLILAPNRELAHQIAGVTQELCNLFNYKAKLVVGGRTKRNAMDPNFEYIDILIGTPGAIGKLVAVGIYKLSAVEFCVLDEADTLLDDSFVDRLEMLLRRLPQSQITLVSATLPKKFPAILEPVVRSLQHIKSIRLHKPLENVKQRFLRLLRSAKPVKIMAIAKKSAGSIIIFTNKNETCKWLAMFLRENGIDCANLNGEMNYAIRIEQWKRFSTDECRILVTTDIGSRGLDTTQVMQVINYDFPFYAADYIHRVGRTGRLGSSSNAEVINFVCSEQEINLVQQIEIAVRTNSQIPNVDGNITRIIQRSIVKRLQVL